ncbi:Asp23/Gls24 family envelope stress response protein [Nonomuraea deserti]|uniref:Asp23/Gls24 family envelope stress response protein n=1 Tax=Nonomuraea deserti TaxID=1848322 RepID=A0A4R4VXH1_9ACTN|nr:Asp23/Gls24 family envelope stress response protein [Nonomuraea deserti]TDD09067.1 Asp23/Gls24 family envelope stress response protein [Nonomuraea deserti]
MTDVTPAESTATVTVPAQRRPPQPPPEGRGRTEVADQVVLKIACLAAAEVAEVREVHCRTAPWGRSPGAGAAPGRGRQPGGKAAPWRRGGKGATWGGSAGGKAAPWGRSSSAEVRRGRAGIRLHVSVAYPAPLRVVAARLREHVSRRVAVQTGLEVSRLDVIVTDLDGEPR